MKTSKTIKVFELAKEIEVSPLELMNRIKELQLPIKNHMAEVDTESLKIILKEYGLTEVPQNTIKEIVIEKSIKSVAAKKKKTRVAEKISSKDQSHFESTGFLIKCLAVAGLFVGAAAGVRILDSQSGDIGVNKNGLKAKWKG